MTAPDPVTLTVPAREGANTIRLVKRDGGTVYWSAAATYYDPSTAEGRSGYAAARGDAQVLEAHVGHRARTASSIARSRSPAPRRPATC